MADTSKKVTAGVELKMTDKVPLIRPRDLADASRALAEAPEFAERIRWWLLHGHACEGWVRFEWAYRLQTAVGDSLAVLGEHRVVDVTLVHRSDDGEPLWHKDPAARIELKWYGNWWVDHFEGVRHDLEKTDRASVPAAAVLLFLAVAVDPSSRSHAWLRKQIAGARGRIGWAEARAALMENVGEPDHEAFVDVEPAAPLRSIRLHTITFLNQVAGGRMNRIDTASRGSPDAS